MRLVQGVGINDVGCTTTYNASGKNAICNYYKRWADMLSRCYSAKRQEKQPTYKGCSVVDEWLIFSNFRSWMVEQDWEGNHLDKDLLIEGNKVYGPGTCVFVSQSLNKLMNNHALGCGDQPIGVHSYCGKYKAQISKGKKRVYLGTFKTPEAAHIAWRKAKSKIIMESAITQQDNRVFISLVKRARELLTSPHQFV